MSEGKDKVLKNTWILWAHDGESSDWTLKSYEKLCEITNISEFWKLLNNFEILNVQMKNYFLMKNGITPLWEDKENRYGGIASFRVEYGKYIDLWTDLCMYTISENIYTNMDDINGISLGAKNSWVVIRLWNKSVKNISSNLNEDFLKKYSYLATRYKKNEPIY